MAVNCKFIMKTISDKVNDFFIQSVVDICLIAYNIDKSKYN